MLTQTSVKKSLAYSTIAQMGFMMLQCGLGAFSAAMLHILAHSLYKAHAFLSSGSVITFRSATSGVLPAKYHVAWSNLAASGGVIVAMLAAAFTIFGIDVANKPGGLLLGGILCLALTYWVGQVMRLGSRELLIRGFAIAGLLCLAYSGCFVAVDTIIASSLPVVIGTNTLWITGGLIALGFVSLFILHAQLSRESASRRLHTWYVHASNGFYIENALRRVFGTLSST